MKYPDALRLYTDDELRGWVRFATKVIAEKHLYTKESVRTARAMLKDAQQELESRGKS